MQYFGIPLAHRPAGMENPTMLKRDLLKRVVLVAVAGAPMVLAAVPRSSERITNDAAIYQNLHEIRVAKVKAIDFDSDIARLSAQEKSHRLPLQISSPMDRVMRSKYKPSHSNRYERKSFRKHVR